ncbi:MAG: SAM-dependent methyltransferase, partial [Chloroflexi bacterium]|nr:SAM-dependent methyltransferase [Chloroflexota bacterium]
MTESWNRAGDDVPLPRALRERIRAAGRITFAGFMEAALYAPSGGYYNRPKRIAAAGDFFTSPSAHPAFGALICAQLREMARLLDDPDPFTVLEMGAGDGTLARDIAAYAPRLDPGFAARLRHVAIDRAGGGRDVPRSPAGPGPEAVRAAGLPIRGAVGCVLSNELLDSFPVHRFVIRDGVVRELYIALDGDRLVQEEGPPSTPAIEARLESAGRQLPDGYHGEVNLRLDAWAEDVSGALDRGFVLTVDYGHSAED